MRQVAQECVPNLQLFRSELSFSPFLCAWNKQIANQFRQQWSVTALVGQYCMYLSISWLKSFGNCSNIWLRHDLKPSVFPFGLTSQSITILQAHHWWADGLLVFLSSEYFLAIPISMFSSYLFTLLKPSRAWFYTFWFFIFLKTKLTDVAAGFEL